MTVIYRDNNSNTVQAVNAPVSGSTQQITLAAGVAGKTAAALSAGLYRVYVPTGFTVRMAGGAFATVAATATDMPLDAGEYYFGVASGDTLSFYHATLTPTIEVTKV